MQIFINTPSGDLQLVEITPSMTVAVLKQSILANVCTTNLSLNYRTKILDDSNLIMSYPVQSFSTLNLSIKCLGGVMTEDDKSNMREKLKKTICRICYATNAIRATNCRKKSKCGGSTKLRPKRSEANSKKD